MRRAAIHPHPRLPAYQRVARRPVVVDVGRIEVNTVLQRVDRVPAAPAHPTDESMRPAIDLDPVAVWQRLAVHIQPEGVAQHNGMAHPHTEDAQSAALVAADQVALPRLAAPNAVVGGLEH